MTFQRLIYQGITWRGLYFASVLCLNIFIARFFEASYSGSIYFITNSFALFLTLISICFETGIGFYAASAQIELSRLGNFGLVWTIIVAFGVFIFEYFHNAHSEVNTEFAGLYYICGSMLINYFSAIYYARKNFITPNLLLTLVNIALIIVIGLSLRVDISKQAFVRIYFLSFLIQGLLVAFFLIRGNLSHWRWGLPSRSEIAAITQFSLKALMANLIFFLVYRIDYWFVNWYCSPSDLGNYIQVSKLVQIFLILPTIIASVVFPYIAGGGKDETTGGVKVLCHALLVLFSIACIILALIGKWLFPWVFGESFNKMYYPFLLLIPGILSLAVLSPISAYFGGQNKIWVNIFSSASGLIVIIIGDLIFIPRYGIEAAATVSSIGYFVCLGTSMTIFMRQERITLKEILFLGGKDWTWLTEHLRNESSISKG